MALVLEEGKWARNYEYLWAHYFPNHNWASKICEPLERDGDRENENMFAAEKHDKHHRQQIKVNIKKEGILI